MYNVDGPTAVTTAAIDRAIAVLWNPHPTQRIKVVQHRFVTLLAPGAGAAYTLKRVIARGTPTTTTTPGIDNHTERAIAPPSGALFDRVWSAQPTLGGGVGLGWVLAAVPASGAIEPYPFPSGIIIPPGAGLALVTSNTVAVTAGGAGFSWLEDW